MFCDDSALVLLITSPYNNIYSPCFPVAPVPPVPPVPPVAPVPPVPPEAPVSPQNTAPNISLLFYC